MGFKGLVSKARQMAMATAVAAAIANTASAQVGVAIVDTGVTPQPPINDNLLEGGFNFFLNNADTSDTTASQHGTTVAFVLNSIAPNAGILPIKVTGAEFEGNPGATDAGLLAAANRDDIQIVVKSSGDPASLGAMRAVTGSGKVMIILAGNTGEANPSAEAQNVAFLGGRGIIVGGVDGSNTIHPVSNMAGNFASHFVVAPAVTGFNNVLQGTSFATPHVAATAALMLERAPKLSAEEVVQIIFETADDLGAVGIDQTYGHGKVNPQRALEPVGETSSGGGGSSTGVAALAIGGAIGYALYRRNTVLKRTLVLDSYDRPYALDFTARGDVNDSITSVRSVLASLDKQSRYVETISNNRSGYMVAMVDYSSQSNSYTDPSGNKTFLFEGFNDDATLDTLNPSMTLVGGDNLGNAYRFDLNGNPKSGFGVAANLNNNDLPQALFLSGDGFNAPYLGFTSQGIGSQFGFRQDETLSYKVGVMAADEQTRHGAESDALVFEGTLNGERGSIGMQLGHLDENGSLFGGASKGAFSVDDARTFSLGLTGHLKLSNDLALIGHYAEGYTSVDQRDKSFLSNFSDLRTDTWGVGLVAANVLRSNDQAGFAVSQPLRVSEGSADVTVPVSINFEDESINYETDRSSLSSLDKETTWEAYYQMKFSGPFNNDTRWVSHLMYRDQPQHDSEAEDELSVLTAIQFKY